MNTLTIILIIIVSFIILGEIGKRVYGINSKNLEPKYYAAAKYSQIPDSQIREILSNFNNHKICLYYSPIAPETYDVQQVVERNLNNLGFEITESTDGKEPIIHLRKAEVMPNAIKIIIGATHNMRGNLMIEKEVVLEFAAKAVLFYLTEYFQSLKN